MAYTVDNLEHAIAACRKNIKVFEDAIEKELATIKEYRGMIEASEKQKQAVAEAAANVHIEVDTDGG